MYWLGETTPIYDGSCSHNMKLQSPNIVLGSIVHPEMRRVHYWSSRNMGNRVVALFFRAFRKMPPPIGVFIPLLEILLEAVRGFVLQRLTLHLASLNFTKWLVKFLTLIRLLFAFISALDLRKRGTCVNID